MERPRHPRALTLVLTTVLSTALAAQGPVVRVSGTVKDESGKPVGGATVTASNPDQAPNTFTASTDARGRFGIGLRQGAWMFVVAAPGFQTVRTSGDVETQRPNPPLNIKLVRGVAPLTSATSTLTGAEIQALLVAAEQAAAAGNIDAAVAGYRDVLTKVPSLTTAYLRIGTLLEARGDTAGALAAYRDLARIDPDNARAAAAIARLTRAPFQER
jgi:tetratricopeptide (TPR) repeat protein